MEEGTIGASSGGDAANALRLRGFSIISLTKEASEKKERRSFLKRKPFSGDETLSVLASEWSALLKAGLTITATLALLEEQAKKHEKPILSRAREIVMEGRTLWETLDESGAFPRFFTALIQVGEMTGTLPEELDRIAEHYRKKAEFKRKAVSALAYPCFVLLFALTVLLTILTFILPTFETLFASLQITLPAGARIALAAGKFLQETGRFLFLLPLLSALGLGISLKTEKGREKIDEILYRSRFCKRLLLIRFAATLSAFLESGLQGYHRKPRSRKSPRSRQGRSHQRKRLRRKPQEKRLLPAHLLPAYKDRHGKRRTPGLPHESRRPHGKRGRKKSQPLPRHHRTRHAPISRRHDRHRRILRHPPRLPHGGESVKGKKIKP